MLCSQADLFTRSSSFISLTASGTRLQNENQTLLFLFAFTVLPAFFHFLAVLRVKIIKVIDSN